MFDFDSLLTKRKRLTLRLYTTCLFLIFLAQSQIIFAETSFFFYNPESNINDFRSLKTLFDNHINKGEYRFQPFDKKELFEDFLKRDKDAVFLMSSWHYQDLLLQGYVDLEAVLVGTLNGSSTYTKVVSTKKNIADIQRLEGKNIASAGNKSYTQLMLENIAQQGQASIQFKVLTVPKDIDALMSVLFGMSQGALTARNSLDALASVNPKKFSLLHQVAESSPIMLPVVAVYKSASEKETQQLIEIIENLPNSVEGKEILGMLGWDGWKKITKNEMQLLRSTQ